MPGFLLNGFKFRADALLYNRSTTNPVGYVRDSNASRAVSNAFTSANELKGQFIAQIFSTGIADKDMMFDPFLASAKVSGDFGFFDPSANYLPFLAIVNVEEISGILTPEVKDPSAKPSKKVLEEITSIALTCGIFRLDNYHGQFAVPQYGDVCKVTYGDPETYSEPIFISPVNNRGITDLGSFDKSNAAVRAGSGKNFKIDQKGFFADCKKIQRISKAEDQFKKEYDTARAKLAAAATTSLAPEAKATIESQIAQAEEKLRELEKEKIKTEKTIPEPSEGSRTVDINYLCKTPPSGQGSLVGRNVGGTGPIINKYPGDKSKSMTFNLDPDIQKRSRLFRQRRFPPINIVIHDTDDQAGLAYSSYNYFAQSKRNVSTHYIIGEDGVIVECMNPFKYATIHSIGWNQFAIGIDLCCKPYIVGGKVSTLARWNGDVEKQIGKSEKYIKGATGIYAPPTTDRFPYNARTHANLESHTPSYKTRGGRKTFPGGFVDYTPPQKKALYGLIRALTKKFNIEPVTVLTLDTIKNPELLTNYPQRFSGVISHMQISEPGRRGDGHRALDLLVQANVLKDLSGWNGTTFTTPKGPDGKGFFDPRLSGK